MNNQDTIAAIATPYGYGGIGIIRISGIHVCSLFNRLIKKVIKPRKAEYVSFYDRNGEIIDNGIALFFSKPNSFTGEDTLELQCHGSPIVLNYLLQIVTSFPNIRVAKPGEFSERAFINNKLDLIQAESIIDLINANSIETAKSAIYSIQGIFSKFINNIVNSLIELRANIESIIDFSYEDNNYISMNDIQYNLDLIINDINKLIYNANHSINLKNGLKLVITGKPNVGKSSLFNVLLKKNSAIVTNISGTTRDILREHIQINGIPLSIIDTAGLNINPDYIENIGIKKAINVIKKANYLILVMDVYDNYKNALDNLYKFVNKDILNDIPIIIVRNKSDLNNTVSSIENTNNKDIINISIKNKDGINLLLEYLNKIIKPMNHEGIFLANHRHLHSLKKACLCLEKCRNNIIKKRNIEIVAEDLKYSQKYMEELTGKVNSEDILSKIFMNFCIGK